MDIVDCIMGIMYIVVLGCVLYYINKFQIDKLKRDSKPINKVHFYVARDGYNELYLFLGKPARKNNIGKGVWTNTTPTGTLLATNGLGTLPPLAHLSYYNLNENDFKNLKWEDEPVEVFLNMED